MPNDHDSFVYLLKDCIQNEVAKYASATAIAISPAENRRLKMLIDKRVLTIMVLTYFLQALDKGTLYVKKRRLQQYLDPSHEGVLSADTRMN